MKRTAVSARALLAAVAVAVAVPGSLRAAGASAEEPRLAPLPVEAAVNAVSFGGYAPISLSPDGRRVAFTILDRKRAVTDPDPRYHSFSRTGTSLFGVGCDVWVADTQTGETRNLTESRGNSWYPAWSPDGKFLAFYSDREGTAGIWIWESASGRMRRISDRIVRPMGMQSPVWTADSRRVIAETLPEGMTLEEAAARSFAAGTPVAKDAGGATVVVFDSRKGKNEPTSWSDRGSIGDLVAVEAADGRWKALTHGVNTGTYRVSPDGSKVLLASSNGFAPGKAFQPLVDLHLVDVETGAGRILGERLPMDNVGFSSAWSPDGKTIAYTAKGPNAKTDCFVVAADGSSPPRLITTGTHPDFGEYLVAPVWHASSGHVYLISGEELWRAEASGGARKIAGFKGKAILSVLSAGHGSGRAWAPGGADTLAVALRDESTKNLSIASVDLRTGAPTALFDEPASIEFPIEANLDVARDGQSAVYVRQDSQHGEELWFAGPGFSGRRRLTHINPEYDRYRMGSSVLIGWRSLDGEELHGAVLLPSDYRKGTRYPLVVYPYGGSMRSKSLNQFGLAGVGIDNMQLLATRGFAVLLPDSKTRVGTPMRDIAATVLPGISRLVELGIADPDRVGVVGHSYGGYSVLSLIVQSPIFKAAVMRDGVGNLVSDYGEMFKDGSAANVQWAEGEQGSMGGTLWEFRSRYVENSPWFYLDRVTAALLITHGGADTRVPVQQAEEVFTALRRLGKEVEYARYDGEDHSELYWGYANQLDFGRRMIGWLEDHLKPAGAAPAPPSDGKAAVR